MRFWLVRSITDSRKAQASEGSIEDAKQAIRERVWDELERQRVARFPGARGRIPNFVGAEAAAITLAQTDEWKAARVVKANPDAPQLPVRIRALSDGKVVYMAVPKLARAEPFLQLDPRRLEAPPRRAASIKGAGRYGDPVRIDEMTRIDLVVCGTVATNRKGARVGKGGGYSDLEFAMLSEVGLVTSETMIVTTVHPIQVLDDELPETEHDFRLDRIATPEDVLKCARFRKRPRGILWEDLGEEKIASIPVLATLDRHRR